MRIYVAGGMRGFADFNIPAFESATKLLRADGHEVFNPAEKDLDRAGLPHNAPLTAKIEVATKTNIREALGEDLDWICHHADAIAMLPGWEHSRGARAEHATALALGLKIIYLA